MTRRLVLVLAPTAIIAVVGACMAINDPDWLDDIFMQRSAYSLGSGERHAPAVNRGPVAGTVLTAVSDPDNRNIMSPLPPPAGGPAETLQPGGPRTPGDTVSGIPTDESDSQTARPSSPAPEPKGNQRLEALRKSLMELEENCFELQKRLLGGEGLTSTSNRETGSTPPLPPPTR